MKRCENCIINRLSDDDFQCRKDLAAPECIGVLQGFVEDLHEQLKTHSVHAQSQTSDMKIDYSISGEGVVYVPKYATDEEIAATIIADCDEQEISIEYLN